MKNLMFLIGMLIVLYAGCKKEETSTGPEGTTGTQPPTMVSPANGATDVSTSPTLTWTAVTNATEYGLQVSINSGFTTFILNSSNLKATTQQLTGLAAGTVHYWRTRAITATDTSAWSSAWSFTTATSSSGGIWSVKSPLPKARHSMAAVALGGVIYIIGGSDGNQLNNNDCYNPATNTWSVKDSLNIAREALNAVAVNGKIYAFGGFTKDISWPNSKIVEEYDPTANTWTNKGTMAGARFGFMAAVYNNKIYVIGGRDSTFALTKKVEEYDPATNTWTTKASLPDARDYAGCVVYNNKIYTFGGVPSKTVYEYDPAGNTWTTKADMPAERIGISAVIVGSKIYATAGAGATYLSLYKTVWEYDPAANSWKTKTEMNTARKMHCSAVVNDIVYIFGGKDNYNPLSSVEAYDPSKDP